MNLLALETATSHCSVALLAGDEQLQLDEHAPQKHAALLLPMVEKLMAEAGLSKSQLDAVAFGQGPGSVPGLRIAAAAAQGITLGLEIPVTGISTLAAVAHQRYRLAGVSYCVACLDARMSEIYWGFYETAEVGGSQEIASEQVGSVADLLEIINSETVDNNFEAFNEVAGDGAELLGSNRGTLNLEGKIYPQALDVALLALPKITRGEGVGAADALPVYLRNRVALTEREREELGAKKR